MAVPLRSMCCQRAAGRARGDTDGGLHRAFGSLVSFLRGEGVDMGSLNHYVSLNRLVLEDLTDPPQYY